MAFRFQKRIKIAPGVRLNISKSGISTSLGVPGATVNVGKKGVKGTAGLPGTGLSYSRQLSTKAATRPPPDLVVQPQKRIGFAWLLAATVSAGALIWWIL
jgi:hypothetical protein